MLIDEIRNKKVGLFDSAKKAFAANITLPDLTAQ